MTSNNAIWLSLRTPAEKAQDEREDEEKRAHDEGWCDSNTCWHCIEARDVDDLVDYVVGQLKREADE